MHEVQRLEARVHRLSCMQLLQSGSVAVGPCELVPLQSDTFTHSGRMCETAQASENEGQLPSAQPQNPTTLRGSAQPPSSPSGPTGPEVSRAKRCSKSNANPYEGCRTSACLPRILCPTKYARGITPGFGLDDAIAFVLDTDAPPGETRWTANGPGKVTHSE